MSESLTPEQIAALVEAAKQGELQDETPAQSQRRSPRLRTVNFARPTKFTSDQDAPSDADSAASVPRSLVVADESFPRKDGATWSHTYADTVTHADANPFMCI